MATIIDCADGRFIAGDPDTELHAGNHWCDWCRGDGLEYDYDGFLGVCGSCSGVGQTECTDPECREHGDRVPQGPTAPTWEQAGDLFDAYMDLSDESHQLVVSHAWELYDAVRAECDVAKASWHAARIAQRHSMDVGGFAGQRWVAS